MCNGLEETTALQDRLVTLRKNNNLTQKEMGEILGVSRQMIGAYEQGKIAPNIYQIIKLANHFGVTSDYILGLSEQNKLDAHQETCAYTGLSKETLDYLHQLKVAKSEKPLRKVERETLENKFNFLNNLMCTEAMDTVIVEIYRFLECEKQFLRNYDNVVSDYQRFFRENYTSKKAYSELRATLGEKEKELNFMRGQYHLAMVSFSNFLISQSRDPKDPSQRGVEFNAIVKKTIEHKI